MAIVFYESRTGGARDTVKHYGKQQQNLYVEGVQGGSGTLRETSGDGRNCHLEWHLLQGVYNLI